MMGFVLPLDERTEQCSPGRFKNNGTKTRWCGSDRHRWESPAAGMRGAGPRLGRESGQACYSWLVNRQCLARRRRRAGWNSVPTLRGWRRDPRCDEPVSRHPLVRA